MVKYKLNLETLPIWSIILLFIIFFSTYAGFVAFGFFGPSTFQSRQHKININPDQFIRFMNGKNESLEEVESGLEAFHSEVYFWMLFEPQTEIAQYTGFEVEVKLRVDLEGVERASGGGWKSITPTEKYEHTRFIKCYQATSGRTAYCSPLVILHVPFISHSAYRLRVQLRPAHEKEDYADLFKPIILCGMNTINASYTWWELVFRYIFVGLTMLVLFIFSLVTALRQPWRDWQTEQKWMIVLLIFLILFNNPLYVLQFYANNWIFSFLNNIFRASFICMLLLSLLIFAHASYKKPEGRTVQGFYFPKLFVVGLLWVITVLTFTWSSYNAKLDPAYSISDEFAFFKHLKWIAIFALSLYVLWLLYHIVRAIELLRDVPKKYSVKFKMVGGITLVVIITTVIIFVVLHVYALITSAIVFISFQVLFNLYSITLAFLFLPSHEKERPSAYDIEREGMLEHEALSSLH